MVSVSVCVICFNQRDYIIDCLRSILSQKTSFDYELIISDDCSTDGTQKIIDDFIDDNLYININIVKNYQKLNIGAAKNAASAYILSKGKYICHMDGDDMALPTKLQAQFEALEENKKCVICTHDMLVVNKQGLQLRTSFKQHQKVINTLEDLILNLPFFAHSSKMFTREIFIDMWKNVDPLALDVDFHVEQAKKGPIFHINLPLGVYRSNSGVSVKSGRLNQLVVAGVDRLFKRLNDENIVDKNVLMISLAQIKYQQAYQSAVLGCIEDARNYISQSISIGRVSIFQVFFHWLSNAPTILIAACRARAKLKGYQ